MRRPGKTGSLGAGERNPDLLERTKTLRVSVPSRAAQRPAFRMWRVTVKRGSYSCAKAEPLDLNFRSNGTPSPALETTNLSLRAIARLEGRLTSRKAERLGAKQG